MRRKSAFVISTAALALAVLAPASQATTDPGGSSAFGLAAADALGIAPMPAVQADGARPARKSVTEHPANKLVNAKALEVDAQGDRAGSRAVGVDALASKLTADAVQVRCVGGSATARMASAVVDGKPIESAPAPNTTIPVEMKGVGTASVTLNKQQRNADGGMTVTGVAIAVPVGDGKYESIDLASATCAGAGRTAQAPSGQTAPVPVAVDDRGPLQEGAPLQEAAPPMPSNSKLPVAG
ncbi:choice-of-anchor P family protein [Nonomuraea sp. NPDC050394]|uniref:choice-of-anchor P family protein n=1 Tax=Nonomuraea sp. NPDC050394 TaxID=3364363 RepID=UPI00379E2479